VRTGPTFAGLAAFGVIPAVTSTVDTTPCFTAFFNVSYDYEVARGIQRAQADCTSYLDQLQRQQFGPPTQWEIFNMMCKTACRSYYDRWFRLVSQTGCDCTKVVTPRCFPSVTDLLCKVVGFCYDFDTYFPAYCASDACGRLADNEDSWRRCSTKHPYTQ
jgi:hypothetical protein